MSGKSKWHVMHGSGDYHLSAIERDVQLWNRIKASFNTVEDKTTQNSTNARNLAKLALERAMSVADFGPDTKIEEFLDPSFREFIAKAYLGQMMLEKLVQIKHGSQFGQGKRAIIKIQEPGVMTTKVFQEDGHQLWVPIGRGELPVGTELEGTIREFSSAPEHGGRMRIEHHFLSSHIQGLVNSDSGVRQVDLEILAKND